MRTREAAEGDDSEQSKGLLEESEEEAPKSQNFKRQEEIMPEFAIAFTGPVPLLCGSELAPASADGVTRSVPAEDPTRCLDICPSKL